MAIGEAHSSELAPAGGGVSPLLDRLGEALLGGAMALAVGAVLMTLFTTAPAFRPGGRGPAATIGRPRLAAPLVTITGGAVITFVSYLAYQGRCREWCGAEATGRAVWWRAEEAWQWAGQLLVASVGLAAAALGLVLAARGMRGVRPSVKVAQVAFAAWIVLALAIPLGIEIAWSG
jgi:hypothetical protein